MPVNIVNVATLQRVRLYGGQPGTAETTLYTVPAATTVKITSIVVANTTTSPAVFSLSTVPSGNTAGPANRLIAGLSVEASAVVVVEPSVFMDVGDFLSAIQVTANAITLTISGETYA